MSEAVKRILVMDDEEIVSEVVMQMLNFLGFEATVVSDGVEAVRKYREAFEQGCPYHAVIMDLNIPAGMGGREAVKEVLQIDAFARVLVSSGDSCGPIVNDYRKHGFRGCIAKPYDLVKLKESINSVLQ